MTGERKNAGASGFWLAVLVLGLGCLVLLAAFAPLVSCPVCEGRGYYIGPIQYYENGVPIRGINQNGACDFCKADKKVPLLKRWRYREPAPPKPGPVPERAGPP
jgi:hypothetical protein